MKTYEKIETLYERSTWYWWPNTFDCIVSDEAESAPDIDSIQDDMVLSFLFGH